MTIGRFARISGLSVHTLRHYDDVGILAPAEVDPGSGYRRYRRDQVHHARVIHALRWIDLPVEEQDPARRDSFRHGSKQRLIFVTLEERAMRDDIKSQKEPLPNKAPEHRLRLLEVLGRKVSKAPDRLDYVIQVEHSHLPASAAKPVSQCASDRALA